MVPHLTLSLPPPLPHTFFLHTHLLNSTSQILPPQFLPSRFITAELAQAVVDAGAVPLLVLCIQEPEVSLKRVSASALSDICKHSPEVRGREEGGGRKGEGDSKLSMATCLPVVACLFIIAFPPPHPLTLTPSLPHPHILTPSHLHPLTFSPPHS